jgi:putative DeoR family transcriptional regulator (stage III sporulation protein D)
VIPFVLITSVHKDVTERLGQINPSLANRARVVLDLNKSERHIRGGLATKEKYLHKSKYSQVY